MKKYLILIIILVFSFNLSFAEITDGPYVKTEGTFQYKLIYNHSDGRIFEFYSNNVMNYSTELAIASDSSIYMYIDDVYSSNSLDYNVMNFEIVGANYDVLDKDGNVFFQVPSLWVGVTQEQPLQLMREALAIILIPLVSWIALRKAYKILVLKLRIL